MAITYRAKKVVYRTELSQGVQKLNFGDLEQASVIFKVTDNNNYSDIGSVLFDVTGKDDPMGPAALGFSYELYNSDGNVLRQLSVLGDDVNETSKFVLNLKAESLKSNFEHARI